LAGFNVCVRPAKNVSCHRDRTLSRIVWIQPLRDRIGVEEIMFTLKSQAFNDTAFSRAIRPSKDR
jgi:hypothetical protein